MNSKEARESREKWSRIERNLNKMSKKELVGFVMASWCLLSELEKVMETKVCEEHMNVVHMFEKHEFEKKVRE
jgi:hypothetical protein